MMLKRKMTDTLLRWKKDGAKTALAILGARQTGKSTIAREFGRKYYEQMIEINFLNDPAAKHIFESRSASQILIDITAYTGQSIIPGNTLILLDEIQQCPKARTAIKFLVENGSCHYIETGSLLGVNFQNVESYPVGFEEIALMFPMDFEEFLWAIDLPLEVIDTLRKSYEARTPVSETMHNTMLQLFYTYLVAGGMPEAVSEYVHSHDLSRVRIIQKRILDLYRLDIAKYAPEGDRNKIQNVFDCIPSQLDAKNNRFKINSQGKNARLNRYENTFMWLEEAAVGLTCFNTNAPVPPLIQNAKRSLFKLYFCDTGLLCAFLPESLQFALLRGDVSVNCGSLLENIFAQSLRSKEIPLYYYDSKQTGELDFLVEKGTKIEVLEIKSGNDYSSHAALDKAMKVAEWPIHQAIVFSKSNVFEENKILYLPFYMVMFYSLPHYDSMIWNVDLSGLLN